MPVPSSISDLSTSAGSNYPTGGESPVTADDYFRTYAAFIAQLRDGKGATAEATVASAATADIGAAASPFVQITGTTTITSFGTTYNGPRFVRFAGALTLTHNATTLILPTGASITTAAGDMLMAVPTGNPGAGWRVMFYQPAGKLLTPRIDASSSAGLQIYSHSGTQVVDFGPGGGSGAAFQGAISVGDAATTRSNLGLVIGTDVLAPSGSGASLTSMLYLGVGQTLQDMTASRAANTVYTNSTSKPIFVNTDAMNDTAGGASAIRVGATLYMYGSSAISAGNRTACWAIVPPGSTYQLVSYFAGSLTTLNKWMELR